MGKASFQNYSVFHNNDRGWVFYSEIFQSWPLFKIYQKNVTTEKPLNGSIVQQVRIFSFISDKNS